MDAIQSKTLRKLRLPVPPFPEQELIFDRYKAISARVDREDKNLDKLRREKAGLMHDLLTGKVQVSPDPAEPAHV